MARKRIESKIKQDLNTRFLRRNFVLDRLLEMIIEQEETSFDRKTKTKINPYDAIVASIAIVGLSNKSGLSTISGIFNLLAISI